MGLNPWAWAEVPGRGRVLVSAVVRGADGWRWAVPEAAQVTLGLTLPTMAELVSADGRRQPVRLLEGGGIDGTGAGRVSPIWGLRTSARSATAGSDT